MVWAVVREDHGGFLGAHRIMTVGGYVALSTGSAVRVYNFWIDILLLQIAGLLRFCPFWGFIAFGWWVGGLTWLAGCCWTRHGQKGLGLFPTEMGVDFSTNERVLW